MLFLFKTKVQRVCVCVCGPRVDCVSCTLATARKVMNTQEISGGFLLLSATVGMLVGGGGEVQMLVKP